MIGRWGLYGDLIRELRSAGLSPEDAAIAATVAERLTRERRDQVIRAARAIGWSYRRIAEFWGIDVARIHRIVVLTDAAASQQPSHGPSPARQAGAPRRGKSAGGP